MPVDELTDQPDPADDDLDELVARADLDALVRLVDARTESRDWAGLLRCRDRARAAVATGRQLWPVATLAEYRLVLHGSTDWAARVLDEESGRFSIGPLTEVAAQRHRWAELRTYLRPGPVSAMVAHECAVRGAGPTEDDELLAQCPNPLEIPYVLSPWEPAYPTATYSDDGIDAPAPDPVASHRFTPAWFPLDAAVVKDREADHAWRDLVSPWTTASNGRAQTVAVEGDAPMALRALGLPEDRTTIARLRTGEALRWLAWAGASGGAHGRRRGAAAGRFAVWHLVAALGGLGPNWSADDDLGAIADELQWFWYSTSEPMLGWHLSIAVHDPEDGLAWAIQASDARF
ncbi:MAG: DUF6183 family protein [Ilumatobacteraceae bacterium]